MICSFIIAFPAYAADKDDSQTIRVGYFGFEGYHNLDDEGNRSGYGYEYLQQMARYTGWTYEYVGYDKSWSEAQKMLENGEIDILTSAQKTPAREEIFDFSDDPIGYSSTIFTIKAGNDKYTIDNFTTFEGIRVGMIEGNSRNADFEEFAREKGFNYEEVMFESTTALVEALQAERIDAIVTSSLRVTNNEWIVSEFGFSPYYVCVKKGNQELLDQVNEAIGKLNQDNPSLQNELENKYYGTDSSNEVAFNEEERTYIANLKASGRTLKVIINPDRSPLSYYEDGKIAGIFGDIATQILDRTGLPYEIIDVADREEYTQYRKNHVIDLCMDMRFDYNQAESEGYRITDSYISANISRVTRNNFSGEIQSVATIANSYIAAKLEKTFFKNTEIVYYTTGDECIQAVKDGKQDACYLYTYVAEKAMEEDITHKLTTTLVPDFNTDFCIGIADINDTVLFSILNKTVVSIDQTWVDARTVEYTETNAENVSLMELVYYHPIAFIIIIGAFLILASGFVLALFRKKARKLDEERAKEI